MPEIKNQFTGGKMNKDVDERLVPKGEYRDAMNIQVSTSEGSDVGTVQNILGNKNIEFEGPMSGFNITDFTCVGSYADEKTDSSYWFLRGPESYGKNFPAYNYITKGSFSKDYILKLTNDTPSIVFTDTKEITSKAEDHIATGQDAIDASNNIIHLPSTWTDHLSVGDTLTSIVDAGGVFYSQNGKIIYIQEAANPGDDAYIILDKLTWYGSGSGYFGLLFKSNCLNFQEDSIITGINIIDDMLIWTDNHNEPKMLNIPRSEQYTDQLGDEHTKLHNPALAGLQNWKKVEPHHMQVIKRKPTHALSTSRTDLRRSGIIYGQNISYQFSNSTGIMFNDGYEGVFDVYSSTTTNCNYNQGDVLLLLNTDDQTSPNSNRSLPEQYDVKVLITDIAHYSSGHSVVNFEIISIGNTTPFITTLFTSRLMEANSTLFDEEMFRFSYRYRYLDGEVSGFAPWSNTVFISGEFKYDQKNAYNYGMLNNITDLTLNNFIDYPNTLSVVSVDLLVKNDHSPSVYLIDTIRREQFPSTEPDANGNPFGGSYSFNPKQIQAILPENQSLRAFDNVPRKALAQEITGNRLVFGNYTEAHDYHSDYINLNPGVTTRPLNIIQPKDGNPSIKTQRNYQVGMVLVDKEGRESPIITSENANVDVPKGMLDVNTMLTVSNSSTMPSWVHSYKYYVKDSSKPAYNLVIDSFYKAENGDYWVSVPSSERNKVQEGDLIELKKGIDDNRPLLTPLRTKVIAIENEAPEFIKINYRKIGRSPAEWETGVAPNVTTTELFADDGRPGPDKDWFKIFKSKWMDENIASYGGGADLVGLDLAFSFTAADTSGGVIGNSYKTRLLTGQATHYEDISATPPPTLGTWVIRLDEAIDEANDWMLDAANTPSGLNTTLNITVYEKELLASSEFHGKFFMKLEAKQDLVDSIVPKDLVLTEETILNSIPVRNLCDGHWFTGQGTTQQGMIDGAAMDTQIQNGQTDVYNTLDNLDWGSSANMTDTWEKWKELLQYYHPIQAYNDQTPQHWFIDRMFFKRIQNAENLDAPSYQGQSISGGHGLGVFKCTADQAVGDGNLTPSYNQLLGSGDNLGWLEEGKWYMELSVTGMMKAIFVDNTYTFPIVDIGTPSGSGPNGEDSAWDMRYRRNGYGPFGQGFSYDTEIYDATNQDVAMTFIPNVGTKFKWDGGQEVFTITKVKWELRWNHTNIEQYDNWFVNIEPTQGGSWSTGTHPAFLDPDNRRLTFILELDKDPTTDPSIDPTNKTQVNATNPVDMIFLDQTIEVGPGDPVLSTNNPAIFEVTQPDEEKLDIYHEASNEIPIELNYPNLSRLIPVGSKVTYPGDNTLLTNSVVTSIAGGFPSKININNASGDYSAWQDIVSNGDKLSFMTPHGDIINIVLQAVQGGTSATPILTPVSSTMGSNFHVGLGWSNCISFRNGIESVYLKDDYNEKFLSKGVKVSSTLDKEYKTTLSKSRLIYSGIFNSTSDVNNLNQFITAEKITKDVNPLYGSIQKLYSRSTADGDLIALCEDRVLKILANKDALFNADGNTNVTSTNNVLGTAIPYSGEYGISKNPESFASEAYRIYFTDKVRGTVMRLSMDGLTPISNHGMKDWFRDNLKLNNTILGSYDDKKDEYNVTLQQTTEQTPKTVTFREDVKGWVSFKSFTPENAISCANEYYTFKNAKIWKHHDESVGRNTFYNAHPSSNWSTLNVILNDIPGSVKSFNTINYEGSQSRVETNFQDNQYYNLEQKPGWFVDSIFTNKESGSLNEFIEKEGKWFNYIKGKEVQHVFDGESDLTRISIESDGSSSFDQASFAIQGLGILGGAPVNSAVLGCTNSAMFNYDPSATVNDGSCIPVILGCTQESASNTCNNSCNSDDGSCVWYGCMCDASSYPNGCTNPSPFTEYYSFINLSPCPSEYGSCLGTMADDGNCIATVNGCTDPTASNYNTSANTDDGSCTYGVLGCTFDSADVGYDSSNPATIENGECIWYGCLDADAENYNTNFHSDSNGYSAANASFGKIHDVDTCIYTDGCTDDAIGTNPDINGDCLDSTNCATLGCCGDNNGYGAENYDPDADNENGSCTYCADWAENGTYDVQGYITVTDETSSGANDGTITVGVPNGTLGTDFAGIELLDQYGNMLQLGGPYLPWTFNNLMPGDYYTNVIQDPSSYSGSQSSFCSYNTHTMGIGALEITVGTTIPCVHGCTDATACNYNPGATCDDGSCNYASCAGCMDPTACMGYDATATISDPSQCCAACGCTDPVNSNYDSTIDLACDDGSCTPPPVYGCMDSRPRNDLAYDGNGALLFAATNYAGPGNTLGAGGTEQTPVATINETDASDDSNPCTYNKDVSHKGLNLLDSNNFYSTSSTQDTWWRSPIALSKHKVEAVFDVSAAPLIQWPGHSATGYSPTSNDPNGTRFSYTSPEQWTTHNGNINTFYSYGYSNSNFYWHYSDDNGATWNIGSNWSTGTAVQLVRFTYDPSGAAHSGLVDFDHTYIGYPQLTTADKQHGYEGWWKQKAIFEFLPWTLQANYYTISYTSYTSTSQVIRTGCKFPNYCNTKGQNGYPDNGVNWPTSASHTCVTGGCLDATACNEDPNATCQPANACSYGTATLYYAQLADGSAATSCYVGPGCDPGNLGTAYTTFGACCTDNPTLCT